MSIEERYCYPAAGRRRSPSKRHGPVCLAVYGPFADLLTMETPKVELILLILSLKHVAFSESRDRNFEMIFLTGVSRERHKNIVQMLFAFSNRSTGDKICESFVFDFMPDTLASVIRNAFLDMVDIKMYTFQLFTGLKYLAQVGNRLIERFGAIGPCFGNELYIFLAVTHHLTQLQLFTRNFLIFCASKHYKLFVSSRTFCGFAHSKFSPKYRICRGRTPFAILRGAFSVRRFGDFWSKIGYSLAGLLGLL